MAFTRRYHLPKIRDVGQDDEATSLAALLFDLRARSACWREIPCRGESLKTNQLSGFRAKEAAGSFVPREGLCTKTTKDLSNRFSATSCY